MRVIGTRSGSMDKARAATVVVVVLALLGLHAPLASAAPRPKSSRGFAVNSASVTEGDAGSKQLVFTVTLAGTTTKTATVRYATAARTASAPADFAPASGLLSFPKGVTQRQVAVTVFGDLIDEADETLVVSLSGATRAKIVTAQGTGTIVDDDPAPVVRVGAASVLEGESPATSVLAFPVDLDRPSGL